MLTGTVLVMSSAYADETEKALAEPATQTETVVQNERKHHSKEEMRQNFAKRLNLTAEQQQKADAIHQKSKAEMDEIKSQMKELHQKANTIRENNKKEFESILTEEQKTVLETMKKEHKGPKKLRQVPMLNRHSKPFKMN